MKLILEDNYFRGPVGEAELFALLLSCADGPHLLETEPLPELDPETLTPLPPPLFGAWLRTQNSTLQSIASQAMAIGLRWVHARQPRRVVHLDGTRDDWTGASFRLTPRTALRLFQLPLEIVVEDAVNDAHFVRAVTRLEFVDEWKEAEKNHWLKFSHAGGITSADRLVSNWQLDLLATARKYVISDSDAAAPSQPSAAASKLLATCKRAPIPCHVLNRRSIENYLPIQALNQWAHSGLEPITQTPKIRLFEALNRMPRELRHFFNFKRGRNSDRRNHGACATSMEWRKLPLADRHALRCGIHPDIASLFAPTALTMKPNWISSDDVDAEMFKLIEEILSHL